jgi:predicted secreted protein
MAPIVGGVLALFLAAAAFVYLGRHGPTPRVVGRVLRMLAFAVTVGIVVALLPFTVDDSGAAASYLLGVPLVAAASALVADFANRAVGITTVVAALVMLVWGLILGLGIGLWFIIPALILGIAAVASMSSRRAAVPSN